MGDDVIDSMDEAEEAVDMQSDPFEISDFPQTLVTEKVIFVVDTVLLARNEECEISTFLTLLKVYFNLKKKISVKPAQFECLLYNTEQILHFTITSEKNIHDALLSIKQFSCDEDKEPLKIDKVFDKIASLVELPDPDSSKKCLPPNWVYHVIWLFGRSQHVPTMDNTNSFDFLMMTPYFALDMLYLCNKDLKQNQCKKISEALSGLNENRKGYFLLADVGSKIEVSDCITKCLGHPLIRIPQINARYDILQDQCYHPKEVVENNNVEN